MRLILNGIFLGTMSTAAGFFIYQKMPLRARRLIVGHPLFPDAIFAALTFFLLGGGVTAVAGATVCAVMTSVLLYIGNRGYKAAKKAKRMVTCTRMAEEAPVVSTG